MLEAISLGLGGAKTLYGLYQSYQAKQDAKAAQEQMVKAAAIPSAVYNMVGLAEKNRMSGMPGEDLAKDQIRSSTQSGVNAVENVATSSSQAIGALGDMFTNEQSNLKKLALSRSQYQQQQDQNYMGTLNTLAQYQSRLSQAKMGVASQQYSQAVAQGQGAIQNIWSGASDVLGYFAQQEATKNRSDEIDKIYGRGKYAPVVPKTADNITPMRTIDSSSAPTALDMYGYPAVGNELNLPDNNLWK